jgi:uncharacterized protein YjbI with pentapeptide repeats
MSDLTESQKELIIELLIDPCIASLFDEYKDKTADNKIIVELLIEFSKLHKLYFETILFLVPSITPSTDNPIINSIQGLWKIYHQDINMESIFGKNKILPYYFEKFCNETFSDLIKNYYGENPPRGKDITDEQYNDEINKCIDYIINSATEPNKSIISKKIQKLKKCMGLQYDTQNRTNLSYCDLSNRDFRLKHIDGWVVNNCNFTKSKFKGDGSTGTCIHWTARNCNFTDAEFDGKICNKTSIYDGSDFTRVNLTTLMYNTGEVSMKSCNFTDAYIIVDGEKLMGKHLLRYLTDKKHIDIGGSLYNSPQDNGYNPKDLDPNIWISI